MTQPPAFPDAAETWNRRYDGDEFLFGTEPNAWLAGQASMLPVGGRILCVADGEGRNSVWLARQGFQVEAFDVAARAVDKARALAARSGLEVGYTVAEVDGFAWEEGAYDGVVAIFVQFADPAMRATLFERMVRSLKPGGVLILQGYTPRQLEYRTGGPPILSHLYTRDLLEASFAQLSILALDDYEAEIHEGQGHRGRSALIGLVARR
jgi:SAM-dependent methyltransferase